MSKQHLLLIKLKTSFPLLYASTSLDIKTLAIASNGNFEDCPSIRCLASQHILYFFSIFTPGFSFAVGNFAHSCVVLLSAPLSGEEKKNVCHGLLFVGNLDPLSLMPGGPVVLFTCLLVWGQMPVYKPL